MGIGRWYLGSRHLYFECWIDDRDVNDDQQSPWGICRKAGPGRLITDTIAYAA